MTIKFLSPIHYIFSNPIYFAIKKIVLPIYTFINEDDFFIENSINYITAKYILDISCDFFSIIGFFIFLELIELNFCDFNKDLRRKIMDRSLYESIDILGDDFDDDDDYKEEEEDNTKRINLSKIN